MTSVLSAILILIGAFFILIAGLGLVRFPDVYLRMHAVTKSMSLGIGSLLLAAAIQFSSWETSIKALLTILFLFLTIPVSSQIIAQVAYLKKIPLWKNSKIDEFKEDKDSRTSKAGTNSSNDES